MKPKKNNEDRIDSAENSISAEMVMNLFEPILNGNQPFFKLNLSGDILMQNKATEKIATVVLKDKSTCTLQQYLKLLYRRDKSFDGFFHHSVLTEKKEEFILNFFQFPETDFLFVYCRQSGDLTETEKMNLLFLKIMKQSVGFKIATDINQNIIWANESFLNFTGYKLDDLLGKKAEQVFLVPEIEQKEIENLKGIAKGGKKFSAILPHFKKNHKRFYARVTGDSIKNDYGEITHFFVDAQDETELIELQEEMRVRNKRVEVVLESLHGGILVEDAQRKIVRTNKNFCIMFGIDMEPEKLIGFDCETAAHVAKSLFEEEDEFINFLNASLIKKEPAYGKVFNLKDGRVFSIDFISMNLNDDFIGTLWKYSDITEQKKNEQLLIDDKNHAEEMAKAKQLFLANMSHEIRTPMNAIMGLSGLLESSELNEEQLKYTKAIKKASENLLVVINDILDISKMDVDKLRIELEAFDFNEFIHQLKDLLTFKIKEKGLEFDVQVSKNAPPYLITDHFRLNQILINIIGNAIKFTNRGGIALHVDAKPIDDKSAEIIFQITDTGIGIEEENLKKIFEVFSQEYANTAKKFGGTGLGLSISNKLSILLGGSLQLNSRKNHGSTVTINIPMQIATADDVEKLKINIDEIDISGKRVLIVDDYEFNRLLANRLSTNFKCIASEAKNGLEALMKIVSLDYDVILMDIQMPVMNGYEALELIRAFKIKTPIIALTANASSEEKDKCLQMGFDDYLTKPFKPEDLKIVIAKVTATDFRNNANSPTEPIFSLDYLDEIANHNEFFKLKTLRILTDELLKSIAEIADAVKEEDIIKLKFIIHKISPTLKSLKIIKLDAPLQFFMGLNNEVKFNEQVKNSSVFIQIVLNHIAFEIVEKYLKTNEKLN